MFRIFLVFSLLLLPSNSPAESGGTKTFPKAKVAVLPTTTAIKPPPTVSAVIVPTNVPVNFNAISNEILPKGLPTPLMISGGLVIFLLLCWVTAEFRARRFRTELQKTLPILKKEIESLSKYRGILDAEQKAAEITTISKAELERARQEAQSVIETSKAELRRAEADAAAITAQASKAAKDIEESALEDAARTIGEAKKEAKELKETANEKLDSATLEAGKIIEIANKRAQEIAGSAYEAMNKARTYEATANAMRNIIEGYGDKFLIPTHSFLDGLAEEYGHTQAGEDLKKARERSKYMVENDTAATCDYAEKQRRETAIRFVIDAFNGKVDSILSRVKSDNGGKLQQEIKDAFYLVNENGEAFRNARIQVEYLNARLEELRLAVIVQARKVEEKEEQRLIKEQLREEERARKEYERAMKDAAKEEEMLRKAMEKVRENVDKANAEERAKFEEKLSELSEKLKAAEEKNQRALSMAQQTKKGYVYVISNIGSLGEDVYKIGLTRRLEPLDRIRELGDASVPFEFDVHSLIMSDDAPALERTIQKHFLLKQINKVNYRKEFFKAPLREIRAEIERMGVTAHWTMLAEAREYRETRAIEELIAKDPAKRAAWMNKQLELEAVKSLEETFAREQVEA